MAYALRVFLVLILLEIGVIIIFMYSGVYNIAASKNHLSAVQWALDTTMRHSVYSHSESISVPSNYSNIPYEQGVQSYIEMCEMCHGGPGVKAPKFAEGMRPHPPELGEESKEWNTMELFWIVKHGIKMTGMPAFGPTHSDEELWPLIAFVDRKLSSLSMKEYSDIHKKLKSEKNSEHGH